MIYLEPPGTDPYFNLALEEYVFEQMDRSRAYFMLWQNSNTIVVGKYQNTAEEINQALWMPTGFGLCGACPAAGRCTTIQAT